MKKRKFFYSLPRFYPCAIIFVDKMEVQMFNVGFPELVVILIIVLLVFGAARLPEIARSLGKAINEFKKAMKEDDSESSKKE